MSESLHIEINSVAPLHTADRLAALGRTIDAFPEIVPTKMGPQDPPRTPVTSVEEQLVAWAPTIHPGDYFNQFLVRWKPAGAGLLWIAGNIWNYPPIGPHRFEYGIDEGWFAETDRPARLERFADLFRLACDSMDACWGGAGLTSFRRQTNDLVFREQVARGQAGRPLLMPGMPGTGWDVRELAVFDLFWLNFFGPAYLKRWSRDAIRGLGARQEPTANGGIVIWATETPFTFQPLAQRLTDYAWKLPFYEALGWDTILHEHWQDPGRGVRVPSYEDHRRFAAGGRRAGRTRQGPGAIYGTDRRAMSPPPRARTRRSTDPGSTAMCRTL